MKPAHRCKPLYALLCFLTFEATAFSKATTAGENWQLLQVQIGSNLALMAGNHVLQAQKDLSAGEPARARDELIKASAVVDVMGEQASIPTAKARLEYADRSLDIESPQKVEADLAPVYSELNIITDASNNRQAKKSLKKALKHLKKGDREGAREELKKIDKLIVYHEIVVPIKDTQSQLQEAIQAIDQKDLAKAKQAVETAQSSLHQNVVAVYDREGKRAGAGATTLPAE